MNTFNNIYKWSIYIFIVMLIVMSVFLFLPKFRSVRELQRRKHALEIENRNIEHQTKELRIKRERFKSDPEFIEKVAREAGRVKPDEVIFKFTDQNESDNK